MMAIDSLKETMPIARISRAMEIPRSTIYYRGIESTGRRKARISGNVETEIKRIAEERTTYGYRRIWAMLRNSGINVNIKTVRRIMRRNRYPLRFIAK
jgi:hypothetical protein